MRIDMDAIGYGIHLRLAGAQQRDLLLHAVTRADMALFPTAFRSPPFGQRMFFQKRIGDIFGGNGMVKIAKYGPGHYVLSHLVLISMMRLVL